MNSKSKILLAIIFILGAIFSFSLFKNIAFPFLWNDEAETAMFASRVLEYGYPKVHDGKNELYLAELPKDMGINKEKDAYLVSSWAQYYFATIGNLLAKTVDNIYLKTAILRIPFAVIGFLGLIILAISVISVFKNNLTNKLLFLAIFTFFELLSVSLVLHLREVRYYSILVFLSACIFYCYINYNFFRRLNLFIYIVSLVLLLLLLFNTFAPTYFVFLITFGLYESVKFIKKAYIKDFIVTLLPLFVSFILILPLLIFFKTFTISREFAKLFNISLNLRYNNMITSLSFFKNYEFLYLVLVVKAILVGLWICSQNSGIKKNRIDKLLRDNDGENCLKNKERWLNLTQKLSVSNFLTLFFIVYLFLILAMPLPVIYERYYILLQPILAIILTLDLFIVYELVLEIQSNILKRRLKIILLLLISIFFIVNGISKIEIMKNHIYELFHQYQGPLDFIIPYIKENYENTERLIIATNYEECSYMYYLGCKVIVGFVGHNLKEDLKIQPDIIIFRKKWGYTSDWAIFNHFFEKDKYARVSFPVFDNPTNNIPQVSGPFQHLFKTRIAQNTNEQSDIYIKQ